MSNSSVNEFVKALREDDTGKWSDFGIRVLESIDFKERFKRSYSCEKPEDVIDPSNNDQLVEVFENLYGSDIPLCTDFLEEIDQLYRLWNRAETLFFEDLPRILGYKNGLVSNDHLIDIFRMGIEDQYRTLLRCLEESKPAPSKS